MAKIQNSKNPIRDGQKVGRVPISMGDGFKNPNGPVLDQNPKDTNFLGKLDPRPMGPIFPIGPRGPIWAPRCYPTFFFWRGGYFMVMQFSPMPLWQLE